MTHLSDRSRKWISTSLKVVFYPFYRLHKVVKARRNRKKYPKYPFASGLVEIKPLGKRIRRLSVDEGGGIGVKSGGGGGGEDGKGLCVLLERLPREIRDMIWEEALGGNTFIIERGPPKTGFRHRTCSDHPPYYCLMRPYMYECRIPQVPALQANGFQAIPHTNNSELPRENLLGLVRSCRQIYREALPYLYTHNTFELLAYQDLSIFLSTLPPQRQSLFRVLHLITCAIDVLHESQGPPNSVVPRITSKASPSPTQGQGPVPAAAPQDWAVMNHLVQLGGLRELRVWMPGTSQSGALLGEREPEIEERFLKGLKALLGQGALRTVVVASRNRLGGEDAVYDEADARFEEDGVREGGEGEEEGFTTKVESMGCFGPVDLMFYNCACCFG